MMKVHSVTPVLKMVELAPPMPGFEEFLASYVFCGPVKVVVDTGPAASLPSLVAALDELRIHPEDVDYIILTHIHLDHAGGVGQATKVMTGARVIAHERARRHLVDPEKLWQASLQTLGEAVAPGYGRPEPVAGDRITDASDCMKLPLGDGSELEVLLTPGHASHHLSLFVRPDRILMAGEAAGFRAGRIVRPSTPHPFDLDEALSSLDRLIALKPLKLCYGHMGCYGAPVARLRAMKRKLLLWYRIVAAEVWDGKGTEEVLDVLRKKDRDLDYLLRLGVDQYRREHLFLVNTVQGLAGAASRAGQAGE